MTQKNDLLEFNMLKTFIKLYYDLNYKSYETFNNKKSTK